MRIFIPLLLLVICILPMRSHSMTMTQGICVAAAMDGKYNDPKGYCASVKNEWEARCIALGIYAYWNDPASRCKAVKTEGTVHCIAAAIKNAYNDPVGFCM